MSSARFAFPICGHMFVVHVGCFRVLVHVYMPELGMELRALLGLQGRGPLQYSRNPKTLTTQLPDQELGHFLHGPEDAALLRPAGGCPRGLAKAQVSRVFKGSTVARSEG